MLKHKSHISFQINRHESNLNFNNEHDALQSLIIKHPLDIAERSYSITAQAPLRFLRETSNTAFETLSAKIGITSEIFIIRGVEKLIFKSII